MAAVAVEKLSKAERDELCVSYAALMLHDDGLEINPEKLNKIIKASNNEVEPYWPTLFSKALRGQDVGSILANVVSASGPAPAGDVVATAEIVADEPEKKEDEPTDVDMTGLFGDDDDEY